MVVIATTEESMEERTAASEVVASRLCLSSDNVGSVELSRSTKQAMGAMVTKAMTSKSRKDGEQMMVIIAMTARVNTREQINKSITTYTEEQRITKTPRAPTSARTTSGKLLLPTRRPTAPTVSWLRY